MNNFFTTKRLTPQSTSALSRLPSSNRDKACSVDEMENWVKTPSGYIEAYTESISDFTGEIEPTCLYNYQVEFLDNNKQSIWVCHKSRQVGMSFGCAAKALAKSQILDDYRAIFISIDKEEADEKIVFARELYHTIPSKHRKKLVIDNKHCLEFLSRYGRTRILSFAQKKPRGKGRNTDVFLDEFAHYMFDRDIWVAALPIILRGGGQATVLSTGFGTENLFYEMVSDREQFPLFHLQTIVWWECPALCTDVDRAMRIAPAMSTEDRVKKFGTEKLQILYSSMELRDFQEEMEAIFAGRSKHYIPPEVLKKCLFDNGDDQIDDEDVESLGQGFPIEQKYPNEKFFCFDNIDDLIVAVRSGRVRPDLVAGFDVGRHHDISVLTIKEKIPTGDNFLLVDRCIHTLSSEPIPDQAMFLDKRVLSVLLQLRLNIDATGLGVGVVDGLTGKHVDRVVSTVMTDTWKGEEVPEYKSRLESQLNAVPFRRDVMSHIYSAKKIVGERGGNILFSAGGKGAGNPGKAGKSHHGDIFWSFVLANSLVPRVMADSIFSVHAVPIVGAPRKNVYVPSQARPLVYSGERLDRIENFEVDVEKPVVFRD